VNFASTLSQINDWSIPERIRLMQAVLDGIAEEQALPELTDELKQEIDRRLAALDANPGDVVPWDEVYARTLQRLKK
jgi:putative addiction module component (TIGR02574 family)